MAVGALFTKYARFLAAVYSRELARRLNTSVAQLYRLLDTTKTRKSINQLISLLQVLDCNVDVVVVDKEAVA